MPIFKAKNKTWVTNRLKVTKKREKGYLPWYEFQCQEYGPPYCDPPYLEIIPFEAGTDSVDPLFEINGTLAPKSLWLQAFKYIGLI